MVGAAGTALIFFMLLIGGVILGLYAAAYAAHVFLVAVDGTAAGYDEVTWPDEPYYDWLWKLFYLVWLVTLWCVPLLFYGRYQLRTQTTSAALTQIITVFVLAGWLLFPISMLSSMGGPSRWYIFHPTVFRRIAKRGGSLVTFYLLSGPVLAAGGLAVALMVYFGPLPMVAAGAAGLAVAMLVYARLFGRLAMALGEVRIAGEERPKASQRFRPSPQVRAAARDPMAEGGRARFVQPEDLPPVNAPDPDARVGYNVRLDDAPARQEQHGRPAPSAPRPVDLDEGQYDLADAVPHGAALPRGPIPDEWYNPRQQEMELAGGGRRPVRPKHPWAGGIFTFPFRKANTGVLIWLTVLFGALGTFVRLAIATAPV